MKKFFMGLFIAFISLVSIHEIKAYESTDTGTFEYLGVVGSRYISYYNNRYTFGYVSSYPGLLVYRVDSSSFSFSKISGSYFYIVVSDIDIRSNLSNNRSYEFPNSHVLYYSETLDSSNIFSYSGYSGSVYLYLYLNKTNNDVGSISWGTPTGIINLDSNSGSSSDLPVVDSEVPEVVIPTTDYYLFFDFDTISDFNVFSDFDFTGFSDYEKLMVTIVVNIFYLGFLGFCCYICLKGLYKMLSWVFR